MIHVLSYFPKYMCCWEYLPATNICSDFEKRVFLIVVQLQCTSLVTNIYSVAINF